MKKVLQVICCAVGSGMIGFFANRLNTVVGSVCFTLGVILLVASIIIIGKKDNLDREILYATSQCISDDIY